MGGKGAAADLTVARIAATQHGVASTSQLLTAGLSEREIEVRQRLGRLHRIHQGVYAVGHPGLSQEGLWMAAVLSCRGHGPLAEAYLSHRSAAGLWRLLSPARGPVDVAIIGENGRERRDGVRVHRPRTLELDMTTTQGGIPVTNPARTISDLRRAKPSRGGATSEQLRRAMRQAAVLGLSLGPGTRPERTRSDLELLFLGICRRHGLPTPEVNVEISKLRVDFLWRERRVIVETDGYPYHRGRIAFEDDRSRDLALRGLGFDVLRLSDAQLEGEQAIVAAAVRRLLERGGFPTP